MNALNPSPYSLPPNPLQPSLSIINNQNHRQLDERKIGVLAEHLLVRARRMDPERPLRDLSIILMDDAGMAEANDALLGHKGPTDVITVRYHAIPGEKESGDIGELYVNVDRAVQVAHAAGRWSPGRELALYIAHGCDHLTGEDDATAEQQRRMRRRELRWLREAEAAGYVFEGLVGV